MNSNSTKTAPTVGRDEEPRPSRESSLQALDTVVTRVVFPFPAEQIWDGMMFYEEIIGAPPIPLRWVIPRAIKTEGPKSRVGDQVKCHYEEGFLMKEITMIVSGERYSFDVTEQQLDLHGSILIGGEYHLRELGPGRTEVSLMTRYQSNKRPRWFWRKLEAAFCHAFHRHILAALEKSLAKENGGRNST